MKVSMQRLLPSKTCPALLGSLKPPVRPQELFAAAAAAAAAAVAAARRVPPQSMPPTHATHLARSL